jgi:GTP cyclohydrolase I
VTLIHEAETLTQNAQGVPDIIRSLLEAIGEDATREGLQRTPERVARAYEFFMLP